MTVPHLDARYIEGKRTLLFGPFANVGPKFLKWLKLRFIQIYQTL